MTPHTILQLYGRRATVAGRQTRCLERDAVPRRSQPVSSSLLAEAVVNSLEQGRDAKSSEARMNEIKGHRVLESGVASSDDLIRILKLIFAALLFICLCLTDSCSFRKLNKNIFLHLSRHEIVTSLSYCKNGYTFAPNGWVVAPGHLLQRIETGFGWSGC